MIRRRVSVGVLAWVIIGLIVASTRGFLDSLSTVSTVGSAVLAVIAWPLVLLNVHIGI